MNHLTAIAKVHELIGSIADDYVINFWLRQIGKTENPELVIKRLRESVKAHQEFNEWVETHSDFYTRNLSWHISVISSKLLFWGFIPEKLKESKVEFSADFNSEVERVRKLYS